MTTAHVFIATSLDGHIARPDGKLDWLLRSEFEGDHGYAAFIAEIDGLIMGRASYDAIRSICTPWPYDRPVWVMSRSMTQSDVPDELQDKVRIVTGSPKAVLAEAAAAGWARAYIDGGRVIQSFLSRGLISDMVITRVPVLLGDGRPLFGPLAADVRLRHEETHSYPSGLVQSRYTVI